MTKKQVFEGNKLITQFMGYRLAKCNNGLAWSSPFKLVIEDVFNIHGRLFKEDVSDYLKFHSSWNWLMRAVEKVDSILPDDAYIHIEYNRCWLDVPEGGLSIDCMGNSRLEATFSAVIEFIHWYNRNKK